MSVDYQVEQRSEQLLARFADKVRRMARPTGRFTFDMTHLIESVIVEKLRNTVGLAIIRFDGDKYDEKAYVKFRSEYPRILLYVQKTVWEDARAGFSYAYFILAHELAHILIHDSKAVTFSTNDQYRVPYAMRECSAEWQADCFAKHLTMPDSALQQTEDPYLLSLLCNVEEDIAEERIRSFQLFGAMLPVNYEGSPCRKCGNFTLVRNGTETVCEICGDVVKELMNDESHLKTKERSNDQINSKLRI